MKTKENKYFIGIDMGSTSNGWCVIDENYKVLLHNRKKMWGTLLFDSANDAKGTRILRAARRRLARRKERIALLQDLLINTVRSKDDSFFARLKESEFKHVDIDPVTGRMNRYNLFEDAGYNDKDYYNEFATIYHLRKHLMTTTEKVDPRLLYLALHHIVKYRGNFINDSEMATSNSTLEEFLESYDLQYETSLCNVDKIALAQEILDDKKSMRKEKVDKIKKLWNEDCKVITAIYNAIIGLKFDLIDLFNLNRNEIEDVKKYKISFSDSTYEENESDYFEMSGNEDLLSALKALHDNNKYKEVMMGKTFISDAMIARYEIHKSHLAILKKVVLDISLANKAKEDKLQKGVIYHNMFCRINVVGSYSDYIANRKDTPYDVFKKYVSSILALNKSDSNLENINYITQELNNGSFMPLTNSVINSYIPYKANENEMQLIIANQEQYYPELKENKDKIISLLTFKRPYFVGVLNSENNISRFSWVTQKINERIYPWNFKDLVDYKACEKQFIDNLTNNCNYFKDEKVLAKNSITYQAYSVLNELNTLKLHGKRISVDLKQSIFKDLFLTKIEVKISALVKYLKTRHGIQVEVNDVSGLADKEKFLSTMSTYNKFKNAFGEDFKLENIATYDKIAEILTVFNDVKTRIEIFVHDYKYSEKLAQKLSSMKFVGWGRFSAKLLTGILSSNKKTILQLMYDESFNFNEIIFDEKYGFKQQLMVEEKIDKFDYLRDVESLYLSPKFKRGVWNSLKLIEEIVSIMGCPPQGIFLESTDYEAEKVASVNRLSQIQYKYKQLKEEKTNIAKDLLEELARQVDLKNGKRLEDKLYLWFKQMGRCLYTNEPISINDLDKCELDHILPRCYIVDNSIENLALVKKIENQQRSNTLILSKEIRENMKERWYWLLQKGLILSKKYKNLTRGEDFTDAEMNGFVARQLVETSQIVRATKELLIRRFDCKVCGIKPKISSLLRRNFTELGKGYEQFFKLRNLNDFHHAKDAYLAAVIGQFTTVAFPYWGQTDDAKMLKYLMGKTLNNSHKFNDYVNRRYGIIIDAIMYDGKENIYEVDENGEILWDSQRYTNVINQMSYNDINVVKMIKKKANGNFYKMQYDAKGNIPKRYKKVGDKIIPLNPALYGGYTGEVNEYMCIVEYLKGKKVCRKLMGVPVIVAYDIRAGKTTAEQYFENKKDCKNCKVLKNIYCNQLIRYIDESIENTRENKKLMEQCQKVYVVSNAEQNNATQLIVDNKYLPLLYYIEKNNDKGLIKLLETNPSILKEFLMHFADKIMKYYNFLSKDIANKVLKTAEDIEKYDLQSQKKFISESLKITHSGAGDAEWKDFDCGSRQGRLTRELNINQVEWISQSITGIFTTTTRI